MNTMKANNKKWKLLELVQVSHGLIGEETLPPIQLQRSPGKNAGVEKSALWFVSGFEGTGKGDSYMTQLLELAIQKETFRPDPDLFLTSVCNPTCADNAEDCRQEALTIERWADSVQPKCIMTFTNGPACLRYSGPYNDVIAKIAEYSEREATPFASDSIASDGSSTPTLPLHDRLLTWAQNNGVQVINFSLDPSRKAFTDIAALDWRAKIGPAIKWLVEGLRFQPKPVEIPSADKHMVIQPLELPPEFANL